MCNMIIKQHLKQNEAHRYYEFIVDKYFYLCLFACPSMVCVCVGGRRGVFNEELWCVAGVGTS